MSANLKKTQQYIEKVLKKEWGKLSFTYELDKDSLDVTNSHLTLNNHTDDITIAINIYSGGMANFRAVFDKADMTGNMLALINQFNRENAFFCAFIRKDGYLELRNVIAFYDEKVLEQYTNEFMIRLARLADNTTLQQITALTHS